MASKEDFEIQMKKSPAPPCKLDENPSDIRFISESRGEGVYVQEISEMNCQWEEILQSRDTNVNIGEMGQLLEWRFTVSRWLRVLFPRDCRF